MSAYRKINGEMIAVTTEGHPQYYFDTQAQAEAALSQLPEGADVFVEEGSVSDFKPIAFSGKASDVSYSNASSGLSATNVQTAIDTMKSTFQAGVDAIFNAIKNAGVTPSSSTPTDCATAIGNLRKTPYTGTYTYPSGSTGGTVDLGVPHDKRYVNAGNVYSKGVTDADGRANPSSTNYITGYNNGVTDADGRANPSSTNYITGYNNGVAAQKAVTWTARQRINIHTSSTETFMFDLSNVSSVRFNISGGPDKHQIRYYMDNKETTDRTESGDYIPEGIGIDVHDTRYLHVCVKPTSSMGVDYNVNIYMTMYANQLR